MAPTAFDADALIAAYRSGVFPMAEGRDDPYFFLVDPPQRGVIPLDGFHVAQRLARTVRQDRFAVSLNTDFAATLDGCAAPGKDREDTWISADIRRLYLELHARGLAHSVECRLGGVLVGGLYGVTLGGAFFGESMFSRPDIGGTDASKVALIHLVARLVAGGFALLDTQFLTEHLARFGAVEIARADYRRRLKAALAVEGDLYALEASSAVDAAGSAAGLGAAGLRGFGAGVAAGAAAGVTGALALQAITHRS